MTAPRLTFFVELASDALTALFDDPRVLSFLVQGGHGVSMGLVDLTTARAQVVRRLEGAGVNVTAWLLLAPEVGYWLTADNAAQARARYREVHAWASEHGLTLWRVGLDVEAPRADLDQLLRERVRGLLARIRLRRPEAAIAAAEGAYAELVAEIRDHGRSVESYQFPVVLDERRAGSRLLCRALGLVRIATDAEVLMLYRSYFGRALVRSYGAEADAIALGVTGGGVNEGRRDLEPCIDLEALAEDLADAKAHRRPLYVFSLEGCVAQDMLPALAALDLARGRPGPSRSARFKARATRRLVRSFCALEPWFDRVVPDGPPSALTSRALGLPAPRR